MRLSGACQVLGNHINVVNLARANFLGLISSLFVSFLRLLFSVGGHMLRSQSNKAKNGSKKKGGGMRLIFSTWGGNTETAHCVPELFVCLYAQVAAGVNTLPPCHKSKHT